MSYHTSIATVRTSRSLRLRSNPSVARSDISLSEKCLPLAAHALLAVAVGLEAHLAGESISAGGLVLPSAGCALTPLHACAALVVLVAGVAGAAGLVVLAGGATAGSALAELAAVEVAGHAVVAVTIAAWLPHATAYALVLVARAQAILALLWAVAQRAVLHAADGQHAILCTQAPQVSWGGTNGGGGQIGGSLKIC